MIKLSIRYDAAARRAVLVASEADEAWLQIQRVCIDRSEQTQVLGIASLSIPWWQFLSSREAIGYYVGLFGLEVEFDTAARDLLENAQQRSAAFYAKTDRQLGLNDVVGRLRKKGFTRELTREQLRNVTQLTAHLSGATFSVPGAGKTTEALALFWLLAEPGAKLLVIAPKNAFAAWEGELKLCVPKVIDSFVRLVGGEPAIKNIFEGESPPRLMLITYHQFVYVRDYIAGQIDQNTWIFLDESHRIKRGLNGAIGNAVLSVAHIPAVKLLLSGTPMPNSEEDLIPQFDFLFPEIDVADGDTAELMKPFYVRTTQGELGLSPPDRRLLRVPLNDSQAKLYRLAKSEMARQAELALKDRSKFRALGRSAIRLLQIVSNPALVASVVDLPRDVLAETLLEEDSPKIAFVCDRARQLVGENKKVVIWTTFVRNVELISSRLSDLGADFIHGGVDAGSDEEEDTREWKIKRFHEPQKNWVLVANPAACGEGISLHEICHNAIYVDRNYNAGQYLQSEDRIHRLGLKPNQKTVVEILYAPGTIDESVNERLITKVGRMARVLDDHSLNIDPVSFDPAEIDDNEALDEDDVRSLIGHLTEAD
jgi:SNF2 family DNA or RNA helicase